VVDPGLLLVAPEDLLEAARAAGRAGQVPHSEGILDWGEVAMRYDALYRSVLAPRFVVLLGIDGTGKSTQAAMLQRAAAQSGVDAEQVWSRWDPLLMKPLIRAGRRAARGASGEDGHARHLSLKRRVFRSAFPRRLWHAMAGFDYITRTGPRVRSALRSHEFVVADRYYHDALVDMAVNFDTEEVSGPRGLFRLFPEPDRVIVLDLGEGEAFARKDDVSSIAYLEARRPRYLELAAKHGWPVVDAGRSPAVVHDTIRKLIWGAN